MSVDVGALNLLQYKELFRKTLTKLFADLEIKKQHLEEREQSERWVSGWGQLAATVRMCHCTYMRTHTHIGSVNGNRRMRRQPRQRERRNSSRTGR